MVDSEIVSKYGRLIENVLLSNGFREVIINGVTNFVHEETYRKVTYVHSLGFVIEYAQSLKDAVMNLYEDGDSYPLSLGECLQTQLQADIEKFMV